MRKKKNDFELFTENSDIQFDYNSIKSKIDFAQYKRKDNMRVIFFNPKITYGIAAVFVLLAVFLGFGDIGLFDKSSIADTSDANYSMSVPSLKPAPSAGNSYEGNTTGGYDDDIFIVESSVNNSYPDNYKKSVSKSVFFSSANGIEQHTSDAFEFNVQKAAAIALLVLASGLIVFSTVFRRGFITLRKKF